MARQMLFDLVDEQPGADLPEVPGTVPMAPAFAARVVAAPAEAMQVRAASESPERLRDTVATYGQVLWAFGQIAAGLPQAHAAGPARIMFPPALLRRAARYIRNAADVLTGDGELPDGVAGAARAVLAVSLSRDADRLIETVTAA